MASEGETKRKSPAPTASTTKPSSAKPNVEKRKISAKFSVEKKKISAKYSIEKKKFSAKPNDEKKKTPPKINEGLRKTSPKPNEGIRKTPPKPNEDIRKTPPKPNEGIKKTPPKSNEGIKKTPPKSNEDIKKVTPKPNEGIRKTNPKSNEDIKKTTPKPNDEKKKTTPKPNEEKKKTTDKPNEEKKKTTDKPNEEKKKTTDKPNEEKKKTTDKPNEEKKKTTDKPKDEKENSTDAKAEVSTSPKTSKDSAATTTTKEQIRLRFRRSSRRNRNENNDQDPVIAPGFGTAKDIQRLANELSAGSELKLPFEAVVSIMKSRGQGIRKSTRSSDAAAAGAAAAAPAASNAWADFMKEEGVSTTDAAAATTSTTVGGTRSSAKKAQASKPAAASAVLDADPNRKRTYQDIEHGDSAKKFKSDDGDVFKQGVLVQAGTMDTAIVGRGKVKIESPPSYHLMVPTKILPKVNIQSVFTSSNSCHSIAISDTNAVFGWGRNEAGQLSANLPDEIVLPTELIDLPRHSNVIAAATGKVHTLFLYQDGTVYAIGNNKVGQCGVKAAVETVPNYRKCIFYHGAEVEANIKQIACGEDFSMAVSVEGHLYSAGSSEFGQLGNGETGEYIQTAGKTGFANSNLFVRRTTFCHAPSENVYANSEKCKVVPLDDSDDVRIDRVACGKHHSIAVEMPSDQVPRVFSWGCGDYGCLGHGIQEDQYFPRLVASLAKTSTLVPTASSKSITSVSAGAHCSLLQCPNGHVYYWGKHRSIGEATMRPSLVDALANNSHIVRHADAGNQTVVMCTANAVTVAWGQGPHGELGLGKTKSSAKPNFVPNLDGARVASMACGYGSTLFVIREDDAEDKAVVKKIPELDVADCQSLIDAALAKTSKREK